MMCPVCGDARVQGGGWCPACQDNVVPAVEIPTPVVDLKRWSQHRCRHTR